MSRTTRSIILLVTLAACGGSSSEETQSEQPGSTSGSEETEPNDGLALTGTLGVISQSQVNNTLLARERTFASCLTDRWTTVDLLGGDIRMYFRIGTDGHVLWVYPSASTIGDRETERCVLEAASRVRFPQPRGGEAEFSWSFGVDPPEEVRPPVEWQSSQVAGVVSANAAALSESCGSGGTVRVTAYVAPGGQVLAAGGSVSGQDDLSRLDCVIGAVRGWTMPDPGSYPAKVSFDIQ